MRWDTSKMVVMERQNASHHWRYKMTNANEMNLKTIDGLTHASIHLLDQIDEQDEIIISLLDQHSKEDLLLAAKESDRIIENLLDGKTSEDYIEQHGEPKYTEIDGSAYQNAVNAQRAFINTYDHCELMVIDQDATYVLVEKGEKLVSPAGFHPSQRVFIKTRTAVSVNKLPQHITNLIAYKLEPATEILSR